MKEPLIYVALEGGFNDSVIFLCHVLDRRLKRRAITALVGKHVQLRDERCNWQRILEGMK